MPGPAAPEAPAAPAVTAPPASGAPAAPPAAPVSATPPPAAPAAPAQPPAAKPEGAKPPEESLLGGAKAPAKPGEQPGAAGAPETYTDFALPEGMSPNAELMSKFKDTAKAMGLSQENAQKLVTLQADYAKTTANQLVSEAERQRTEQLAKWKTETQTALGANWKSELGFAAKALDAFGGADGAKELRAMLTASGLGDHPLMAKFLVAIGKAMSEAQPGVGTQHHVANPEEQKKRAMFPKMYPENAA